MVWFGILEELVHAIPIYERMIKMRLNVQKYRIINIIGISHILVLGLKLKLQIDFATHYFKTLLLIFYITHFNSSNLTLPPILNALNSSQNGVLEAKRYTLQILC